MKFARLAQLVPILVVPLAAMTLTIPASASARPAAQGAHPARPAAGSAVAAYLWSTSDPTSGPVSLNMFYAFSTAGHATITASSAGVYVVSIAGLGSVADESIVQASAYGSANTCAVAGWGQNGSNLQATVICFDHNGGQSSSEFTLIATRPTSAPHGTFDYAFVYKNSGRLPGSFEYNSAGRTNTVANPSLGHYVVTLPGPKTSGTSGTVKVTPYGDEGGDCTLVSWRGSAAGEIVNVDCRTAAGAFQSRKFMVTYAATNNLMGLNRKTEASALASGTAAIYQPVVQYDSARGGRVTIIHEDTGRYEAVFVGSEGTPANGGDIQVNAVSGRNVHCVSEGWGQGLTPTATIFCLDGHGNSVNTPFVVDWVVG